MPKVLGVDLPGDRPAWIALTAIYGIGKVRSREVFERSGVSPVKRARELTTTELRRLEIAIRSTYRVEGELKRELRGRIKHEKDVGSYRGLRHRRGLPVRGQRTRSNARTRKGPRVTVCPKPRLI
ncbi:MAG: 30S ribosomal protein S13 [Planctomycetes bacterium]|nr:30S ribosomal protein S13 [Planctomycetota bacterium]